MSVYIAFNNKNTGAGSGGPGGMAIPPGGTKGQVIAKISDEDYNVGWVDPDTGNRTVNATLYADKWKDKGTNTEQSVIVPGFLRGQDIDIGLIPGYLKVEYDAWSAMNDGGLRIDEEDGLLTFICPKNVTPTVNLSLMITLLTTSTPSEDMYLEIPSQRGQLTYTGSSQSPEWDNYDSTRISASGVLSGINAESYVAFFKPFGNYLWSDGTNTPRSVTWTIRKAEVLTPVQSGTLTYNNSEQRPTWNNFDSGKMTVGGVTSAVNAGSYTAIFTLKDNYQWPDGTTTAKNVTWKIGRTSLTVPTQNGTVSYTGDLLQPSWNNYDSTKMVLGGVTSGTNAGEYTATFTPIGNYQWSDDTSNAKNVIWRISKGIGSLSLSKSKINLSENEDTETITVSYVGDGELSVSVSDKSIATATLDGNSIRIVSVSPGTATLTVSVQNSTNYVSPTAVKCEVEVTQPVWTFNIPRQSNPLVYNGKEQRVNLTGASETWMTTGGVTSATNAGEYVAIVTPTVPNYWWSDGTTGSKEIEWYINKAAGSLSLSKSSVNLNGNGDAETITVSYIGDGELSVSVSDENIAVATLNGRSINIVSINSGTATLTVSVENSRNYTTPSAVTCSINSAHIDITPTKWSVVTLPSFTGTMKSIAYGNGVFVLVGSKENSIWYSYDAKTWTLASVPASIGSRTWSKVTYGGGKFIVSGSSDVSTIYSTNGRDWLVGASFPSGGYGDYMCYGDRGFISWYASSSSNDLTAAYVIGDGENAWIERNAPSHTNQQHNWEYMVYNNGTYVASSSAGMVQYSSDAINWKSSEISNQYIHLADMCCAEKFLALRTASAIDIYYSSNAAAWDEKSAANTNTASSTDMWTEFAYGADIYIAVSHNYFSTSTDGFTWTEKQSLPASMPWRDVVYGGNKFVLIHTADYSNEILVYS